MSAETIIYQGKNTKVILKDNKVLKITSKINKNEPMIQRIAHKLGIAPGIFKVRYHEEMLIEMEYIKGYDLDSYIKLPNIDKNKLKKDIRIALNKMYDNGINHKDLTGKDIIINTSGDIKIIDYGNSVLYDGPVPKPHRDYGVLMNF